MLPYTPYSFYLRGAIGFGVEVPARFSPYQGCTHPSSAKVLLSGGVGLIVVSIGFRVWGFRVLGLGVQGFGFWVQGLGPRVQVSGFRA